MDPSATLEGERPFSSFPHKPYSIQLDFMRSLYASLDNRSIGLFESPTGISRLFYWCFGEKVRFKERERR